MEVMEIAPTEPSTSDDPRVLKARSGDTEAFADLVRELEQPLFASCYSVLRQREAAEDAVQDAFLNAWRNIGSAPPHAFRAWMHRIAFNAAVSQLRRSARRPYTALDGIAEPPSEQPEPETVILNRELRREIENGLDHLPDDQRTILVLRHQNDLEYDEIARITGANLGTVKSRMFRARRRLSALLAPPLPAAASASQPRAMAPSAA